MLHSALLLVLTGLEICDGTTESLKLSLGLLITHARHLQWRRSIQRHQSRSNLSQRNEHKSPLGRTCNLYTVVTEIVQGTVQANSTLVTRSNGGDASIQATYNIDTSFGLTKYSSRITQVQTVEVLTHGIGLDESYWDIASNYSYFDTTTSTNRATLSHNRLGVGAGAASHLTTSRSFNYSWTLGSSTASSLASSLYSAQLSSAPIHSSTHSYGSSITVTQTATYPDDLDATILTGAVSDVRYSS